MDLYIYYKVKDADAASLQAAVVPMQATLAQRHGVAGQLKRRPEARDGVQTWMEVYPSAPEGFATALDEAVAAAGLSAWTSGPRHTEVFGDVVSCA
ncbi:DUF4936 family protein [Pseudoduganella sp. FT25W]|jgi:hypothetical protein|uniref:DUF4936 family protein n=1 Tax=Duganella alba TaxID=2666081 RepID=A0A6L5Q9H0_9BURK|nr:DUF4936 family protein [Duganella alba]MRX06345.1 DUF4936 family protein [Duganella alba]MRX14739.1 DUF4936 family protein [Duganella alba]